MQEGSTAGIHTATPEAPHAETAAKTLKMIAVGISTEIPIV